MRGPNKKFWQRKPDGKGGWLNKLGDTRKVIYRLPQVNEAIAAGYTIVCVEGEKDADNLWRQKRDSAATTMSGGWTATSI